MRSIPLALAWETYRRSWVLLAGFLGGNAITVFLMSALRQEAYFNPLQPELLAMHIALVQLNMCPNARRGIGLCVCHADGPFSRDRRRELLHCAADGVSHGGRSTRGRFV